MKEGNTPRALGSAGEQKAASYLEKQGVHIVEKNFRNRQGEIDLIGIQEGCLVFVEVKYRSTRGKGIPESAVTLHKQRKICRVADYYRTMHALGENTAVRYDVVTVQGGEITWIRNAFPHIYQRRQQGGL